ncbi:MAG: hypothetical protein U0835_00520 [Isosphaeraceae bacterium]
MTRCPCGPGARGTCPHSVACPDCKAPPWSQCKRPSGHPCSMHTNRYRKAEREDAAKCPGFEPIETPAGIGCRNCSGLPEDHGRAAAIEAKDDAQGLLF